MCLCDRWPVNSPHKGPVREKCFHLMTSLWPTVSIDQGECHNIWIRLHSGGLPWYDALSYSGTRTLSLKWTWACFIKWHHHVFNKLRPRENSRHFPYNIFIWISLNANVSISIKISLKFVPKAQINNIPALVQIMAWRRSGDKPLVQPMMVSVLTHTCGTRPQWVKKILIYGWWIYLFSTLAFVLQ